MKGRGRIRVLVPILGLALGVSVGVALPRVAHELPRPLSAAARWPERLWTRDRSRIIPGALNPTGLCSGLARRLGAAIHWID